MIILTKNHLDAELQQKSVLAGQFRLVVRGPEGDIRRDTGWFDNLILDSGLNRWGTGAVSGGAAIGTGTSTPVASQTGLDAQSAYTTTSTAVTQSNSGASPYYGIFSITYTFALGALNGNYSEVGIGWASGSNMFSRALIVDGGGTPTTISVSSAEQLSVSYTLRGYVPTADVVTTPTIGGVSTTVTTRAANASANAWGVDMTVSKGFVSSFIAYAYNGAIGAITALPSGTSAQATSVSAGTYVNNSLSTTRAVFFGLTDGNLSGGISAARCGFGGSTGLTNFQYGFSPAISKDSTKTLTLSLSHTWARRP